MTDLSELFTRDPLKLSDADIDSIVAYMRTARERYMAGDKNSGAPKKMKAEKVAKEKAGDIDIGDLEL